MKKINISILILFSLLTFVKGMNTESYFYQREGTFEHDNGSVIFFKKNNNIYFKITLKTPGGKSEIGPSKLCKDSNRSYFFFSKGDRKYWIYNGKDTLNCIYYKEGSNHSFVASSLLKGHDTVPQNIPEEVTKFVSKYLKELIKDRKLKH